jgi:hypothetical protein
LKLTFCAPLLALFVANCTLQPTTRPDAKVTKVDSVETAKNDAVKTYTVQSNACEAIRIGLLACIPEQLASTSARAERDALCKKAVNVTVPTAFDNLHSSIRDDAVKSAKIDIFKQHTDERFKRVLAAPEEAESFTSPERSLAVESRNECFALLDELD